MKKTLFFILILIVVGFLAFQFKPLEQIAVTVLTKPNYINKEGLTIKTRATILEGFIRETYPKGSFQEYVQNYKLKEFDAKIVNYDGSNYFNQIGHFGVLEIPVPKNGLQQCADALIRIRSEYFWDNNRKDEIGFNFTSGHYCSWKQYENGYRPKVKGNKVTFHKTAKANTSKKNFYAYLNLIYMYSGTISLYSELPKINSINKLKVGDMLIIGGSPGHVVMIADVIKNEADEKRFLLFQGNTPAQSVHLLKNLENTTTSPWYELQLDSEISVPGYTFYNSKFVRFK